jgi:hypothetical protein
LIHGSLRMKIRRDITYGSDYKLDVIIYEGTGTYNALKPVKIDPKRLVLLLPMLIVLIYTVSLLIPSSFKLDIHNQRLDVSLVSPVYVVSDGLECYRAPDYKVYTGDTMRSGFIIKPNNVPYGVLVYKLRGRPSRESTETGENTSSTVHLLVVWRISEFKMLYADVLLIEHTKTFTWNRDILNKLYYENHDRLKKSIDTISDKWLIYNNMVLKTTFSVRGLRENPKLSISISEERDEYAIRPFCIDLER